MEKNCSFDNFKWEGWPSVSELEPYFLAPKGKEWFFESGNDTACFSVFGLHNTDNIERLKGRIDVWLYLVGHPDHGLVLLYKRYAGGYDESFSSRGDLSRIREWVRTLHGDVRPIGLFVPFAVAWEAVKEFIETDGELPKSIEWVANRDLPENTFPDPHDIVLPGEKPAAWLSPEEAARAIALGRGKR